MIEKIDHIGLAVFSLEEAGKTFQKFFSVELSEPEEIASQGIRVQMFQAGESLIELLEPTDEKGPIARFLKKRGEGIHHIAFGVSQINEKLACLKDQGAKLIFEDPQEGANGKQVSFLHPSSTHSVLIELCERKG